MGQIKQYECPKCGEKMILRISGAGFLLREWD